MKVQVSLRAEKLGNIARGRWRGKKSNPYATVSLVSTEANGATSTTTGVVEVGKTEVIHDNLSPQWTTIFVLEHNTTKAWTPLKITIHDSKKSSRTKTNEERQSVDGGGGGLFMLTNFTMERNNEDLYKSNDPVMGEVNVEVGEILRVKGQEMKLDLEHGGCIHVHITQSIEEKSNTNEIIQTGQFNCHLRGLDLENIEKGILGLGAIDPYFELSKKYTDHDNGITQWVPVYRSEHRPNIINPYWHPFQIDLEKLCHGNLSKPLKIAVWDYQSGARSDRWLGEVEVNVEWLQKCVSRGGNACREDALSILNDEQEEIGLVVVLKADIVS